MVGSGTVPSIGPMSVMAIVNVSSPVLAGHPPWIGSAGALQSASVETWTPSIAYPSVLLGTPRMKKFMSKISPENSVENTQKARSSLVNVVLEGDAVSPVNVIDTLTRSFRSSVKIFGASRLLSTTAVPVAEIVVVAGISEKSIAMGAALAVDDAPSSNAAQQASVNRKFMSRIAQFMDSSHF